MSSTHEVKECVSQLCRLLKYASICYVSPENFRQAKQNRKEARPAMMNLVLSVFHLLSSNSTQERDISTLLKSYGYPRYQYLKFDLTSCGSKELMICFSWLVHCFDVVDMIKTESLKGQSLFKILQREQQTRVKAHSKVSSNDCTAIDQALLKEEELNAMSFADQANYIFWLKEKTELKFNQLAAVQTNNAIQHMRIMENVHASTGVEKTKQATNFDELLMIKYPHLTNIVEKDLEEKAQVLQAYIKWKSCEHIYWEWMADIVADTNISTDTRSGNRDFVNPVDCVPLKKQLNFLESKLAELKNLLYHLQKTWLQQVKDDHSTLSKVRVEQKVNIEKDVDELFYQISTLSQSTEFVAAKYADKYKKHFSSVSLGNKVLVDEIKNWTEVLKNKQDLWKEELTMLANTILGEKAIMMPL